MKIKILIIALLGLGSLPCSAQMIRKYSFAEIPKSILPRALCVIRTDESSFQVFSKSQALEKVHTAVTILNKEADDMRMISVSYDQYSSVSGIKGYIYDRDGNLIYKLKKNDIADMADDWAPGIVSDIRSKKILFPVRAYPYTIEYEYTIKYNGLINYPELNYSPLKGIAIERSGIQCIVPENMNLRYKEHNLKFKVDSFISGKSKVYVWQEENIPAALNDPWLSQNPLHYPYVLTAPSEFTFGGYDGDLSSWKGFGEWEQKINEGRDDPDAKMIEKVNALTAGAKTDEEKVKILYEYLQANTRYVLVSFGLGGYQTAPVSEVEKTGYGDCKALSNYMRALLKAAGLQSYYTLILANKNANIDPTFPMNNFNHVIVNVPLKNDTIWLECTDQDCPLGFLGTFTDNRYALAIGDTSVKLVHTPFYDKKDNKAINKAEVSLKNNGNAGLELDISRTGILFEDLFALSTKAKNDAINWLSELLPNNGISLDTIQFRFIKSRIPSGEANVRLTLYNFASSAGQELVFTPCILMKVPFISEKPGNAFISTPYELNDSIQFALPPGYSVDYLPENVTVQNDFGSYQTECREANGKIIYTRHFILNSGNYDAFRKVELSRWINEVARLDRRIALIQPI